MKPYIFIFSALLLPGAVEAGSTLEQLTGNSVISSAPGSLPMPVTGSGSEKIGQVTSGEAVALAKEYLDKSLGRKGEYPKEKFWGEVRELRQAFDNRFDFRTASCEGGRGSFVMFTKKTEYYLSQSSSRKKNIIHVCRGYEPGTELMAQDLLHEVSHLVHASFENYATELEMVVTRLGGGYPVMNGYLSYNEGLTQEDLEWMGYGYLPMALGITSKMSFHYQYLRANIVYDNFESFVRNMNKVGDERAALLDFKDIEGFTLTAVATKYQRSQFLQYIKTLQP